jgi:hypothetical protein
MERMETGFSQFPTFAFNYLLIYFARPALYAAVSRKTLAVIYCVVVVLKFLDDC